MKAEVTRNVISDLWPLYRSREASADSRALVDAYLSTDSAFTAILQESEKLAPTMPSLQLSPEAERLLLDDARERARWKLLVIGGAVGLVGLMLLAALGGALLMFFRSV